MIKGSLVSNLALNYSLNPDKVPLITLDKILVYGDMHFDDFNSNVHVNYWETCTEIMTSILKQVEIQKPDLVVFVGDVFGVLKKSSISKHNLLTVLQFFEMLPDTILMEGNHIKRGGDFDIVTQALSNVVSCKDFGGVLDIASTDNKALTRFWFQDYGYEDYTLNTSGLEVESQDMYKIVLAHNDFTVSSLALPATPASIDLVNHSQWSDVDIILSGHIHTPSKSAVTYQNKKGNHSYFVNLGCPTRTTRQDNYDFGRYVILQYTDGNLGFETETFELPSYDTVFLPKDISELDELAELTKSEDEESRMQKLKDVLAIYRDTNVETSNIRESITNIDSASENAKKLCFRYLDKAEQLNGGK